MCASGIFFYFVHKVYMHTHIFLLCIIVKLLFPLLVFILFIFIFI